MHSGHSCGAKSTVARDTGLITPGKKNIYNANFKKGALDSDFMFVNIEPYKSKKCVPYKVIKILRH